MTARTRTTLRCRFHNRSWSKTCEECNRCLDELVVRRNDGAHAKLLMFVVGPALMQLAVLVALLYVATR